MKKLMSKFSRSSLVTVSTLCLFLFETIHLGKCSLVFFGEPKYNGK